MRAAAARALVTTPASSDDEVSENDEITILQARADEAMRAMVQCCRVEDNVERRRVARWHVVCAGLGWPGSTSFSLNYPFNLHGTHGLVSLAMR